MARTRKDPNEKVLRPVRANAGLEAAYRRRLATLVDAMHRSVLFWVKVQWKAASPEMALDAPSDEAAKLSDVELDRLMRVAEGRERPAAKTPRSLLELQRRGLAILRSPPGKPQGPLAWELTVEGRRILDAIVTPAGGLRVVMERLAARWQTRFDEAAAGLAEYFAKDVAARSDAQLRSILKKGGFTVQFQMTPAARDVMQATIGEQVGLIRTIPQQYLGAVQGAVMRSVQAGRDLAPLAKEIEERYGLTKKRAAFIARDQNNKATASMTRVRQVELGALTAVWRHSGAGREPRPEHVRMSGKRYDVRKGMWDAYEKEWIFPGTLPNCRCTSQTVLPGFS